MKLNNKKSKMLDKLLPRTRRILPSRAHRAAVSHLPTRAMPLALVHPAFRRFFSRPRKFIKRHWKQPSVAIRIRNRTIHYCPLPRVAPFFCQKCRFSSYHAHAIKNHICSRRASTVYSLEREEKIVASGFRCKSKNAQAVLERAPNPNVFTLSKLHTSAAEPSLPSFNVASLSVLAYRALSLHSIVTNYPTSLIFESTKTTKRLYPSTVTKRTDVIYCKQCNELFYEKTLYYEHFNERSCEMPVNEEEIIHVQCRGAECVPIEYEFGRRKCLVTLQSGPPMKCTACGVSSREFTSDGEFHKHLFKCSPRFSNAISSNGKAGN
uniref:C2H2-type domain-containing protein n=2 Tax=Parascaris univalens TaxID=6257 RepID=A0A914ZF99_PARUN